MQYYDYRSYFQTLITNQNTIITNQTSIINFINLFVFIFTCYFLYVFIRNMIKNRG